MHRCLKLLEIVGMVFSHLYVPPDRDPAIRPSNRPESRALAALARTSSFFSDVALDFLWRSAVLINLLRCLPADLWSINEEQSNKMVFLRPLLKTDWSRVSMYASRVRELSPGSDDLTNVLPVLTLCLPANLLPNLRTLRWESSGITFPYISLFLDPTISNISFHSSQSSLSLLPFLPEKCPNLKTFEMTPSIDSLDWDTAEEIQAVTAFVCGLKSIEVLSVPVASRRALEHTSHLPNLKLLALDTFPLGISFPVPQGPTFQALYDLRLHYTRAEDATNFLTMFHEVPLSMLTVCLVPPPTADQSNSFCAAVVAGVSPASLTALRIQSDGARTANSLASSSMDDDRFQNSTFRILTGFQNLTFLTIYGEFDLDNAVVADMARAWPQLLKLELHTKGTRGSVRPRVTLQCLDSFARYSPGLATLTLTFDATVVPTPEQQPASPLVAQHSLGELCVQKSPISHPEAVAEFLSCRFPSLRQISRPKVLYHGLDRISFRHEAGSELWEQVETILTTLGEV
ncbi:hypothetical protein C8R46DRAFT_1341967 [Mycena filopes]|nr:hypothetical protein C8R46DRAFT_1341967 [Mycena filopes]